MFSKNMAYYYEEPEEQLFQRQLPYKSVKIPYREPHQRVLRQAQRKYEVETLRQQIFDRCKFEEVQYLEMLKLQREAIENGIKNSKKQYQVNRMEDKIIENKRKRQTQGQSIQDSLDKLEQDEKIRRKRTNSQKLQSSYNELYSIGNSKTNRSIKQVDQPVITKKIKNLEPQEDHFKKYNGDHEIYKQQQIKRLKEEMLKKYKFYGQSGKKPAKQTEVENPTEVNWWINKVREYRQKQQNESVKHEISNKQNSKAGDNSSEEQNN